MLTGFVLVLGLGTPVGAKRARLPELQGRWLDTARKINYYQRKLGQAKKMQESAAHQLLVSERRLQITHANLLDIQSQLRVTRTRLAVIQAEVRRLRERLRVRNEFLARRLVDTYKHGNSSYLSIVVGAADAWDLLSRGYAVKRVLRKDVELIEAIEADKRAVEEQEAVLAEQERRRSDLECEQRVLQVAAYSRKVERARILRTATNDVRQYAQLLAEEQKNSRQIEALIRSLQRTPEGQKRLTQVWRGSFIAPVSSYQITSRFGMRFHPIVREYRPHTGVDLACPFGTTIKAAAGGVVTYVGWMGVYGNTIIIDHGGGMSTVYAHGSSMSVRKGSTVRQGEAIGRVGSTGWSTGPHLHFEVRRNGVPINPL
jgi:murein DD-endopeptidase MepM/ murein hydrolase activator NlpD